MLILLTLAEVGGLILEEMEFVGTPILASFFSFHTAHNMFKTLEVKW